MNWLRRLADLVWCDHHWVFVEQVKDGNLRTGHPHFSNVWKCLKCGKFETRELSK